MELQTALQESQASAGGGESALQDTETELATLSLTISQLTRQVGFIALKIDIWE